MWRCIKVPNSVAGCDCRAVTGSVWKMWALAGTCQGQRVKTAHSVLLRWSSWKPRAASLLCPGFRHALSRCSWSLGSLSFPSTQFAESPVRPLFYICICFSFCKLSCSSVNLCIIPFKFFEFSYLFKSLQISILQLASLVCAKTAVKVLSILFSPSVSSEAHYQLVSEQEKGFW